MSNHVIRGWNELDVHEAADRWIAEKAEEWCEEWERSSVLACHSSDICLKPFYVQLWRVDDEE